MRDPASWRVIEEPGTDGIGAAPPEQQTRSGLDPVRPTTAPGSGGTAGGPLVALGGGPAIVRLALAAAGGAVVAAALVLTAGGAGAPVVAVDAAAAGESPVATGTVGPTGGVLASARPGDLAAVAAGSSGADLLVDVEGAVEQPGVVSLPPGARVGDAIEAAGGYAPSVDVDRAPLELNLAAPVSDGDRIRVPAVGDAPASPADAAATAPTPGPDGGADGSAAETAGPLDLNRATQAELEALPGIGPVTARKIIDARDAAPFTAVDDLRTRKLVGAATYAKLDGLVTVGP